MILLPMLGAALFSQNRYDFDSRVDFSLTLKELNALIEKGRTGAAPTQKIVILSGTLSNIAFLDETTGSYAVQVELTGGEWINVEEVKSYRVLINFSGREFEKYFNKLRGPDAPAEKIEINSSVIIAAQILSTVSYNGKTVWLLKGFHVRKIE